MIDYGEQPSNQMAMAFEGLTDEGHELMAEARRWAAAHITEWSWYKRFALEQCAEGKEASPNFVLQSMRAHFHCEIKNSMAPALARIAMEEHSGIKFRLAKSKVDGFAKVKL